VGSSQNLDSAALDTQRLVQRDWLEVFDGHFAGKCDDVMQLVDLAHGIVEDAGDDTAVGVAGRSGVTLAEAEAADEGLAFFVEGELEAHAAGIVHAADEAAILLDFDVAGVVAFGLAGHGNDSNVSAKFAVDCRSPVIAYFETLRSRHEHMARVVIITDAWIPKKLDPEKASVRSVGSDLHIRERKPNPITIVHERESADEDVTE
jgi:hypothetical protein